MKLPLHPPQTLADVQRLIDTGVMESIHLDYKASAAVPGKPGEIAKDISAFANSAGGIVVYGVAEENHYPQRVDSGIDHSRYSREWLENTIQSNVSPPLDELLITQIPLNHERSIFVVSVPKSARAPHQERRNLRYYKRYNFKCVPMEDYEIEDVRSRHLVNSSLLHVDIVIDQGVFMELVVENKGDSPIQDIQFKFDPEPKWEKGKPFQFTEGISVLPPGRRLYFHYATLTEALKEGSSVVRSFRVEASYYNPTTDQRLTDSYSIDIQNYDHTSIIDSELHRHGVRIERSINNVVSELKQLNKRLERMEDIAGPTGIDLSVTTIRNLASIFGTTPILEPLGESRISAHALQEVLGIDLQLARNISRIYRYVGVSEKLEELDGVDDELIERLRQHFRLSDD